MLPITAMRVPLQCTHVRNSNRENDADGCWLETMQKFRLGVPIRDMRLLDPNLLTSETGKILVRDNAIVFSVEHVRLIITADCVIIPQTGFEQSSLSTQFAVMLEEAIIEASQEKEVGASILILSPQDMLYSGSLDIEMQQDAGHTAQLGPPPSTKADGVWV